MHPVRSTCVWYVLYSRCLHACLLTIPSVVLPIKIWRNFSWYYAGIPFASENAYNLSRHKIVYRLYSRLSRFVRRVFEVSCWQKYAFTLCSIPVACRVCISETTPPGRDRVSITPETKPCCSMQSQSVSRNIGHTLSGRYMLLWCVFHVCVRTRCLRSHSAYHVELPTNTF